MEGRGVRVRRFHNSCFVLTKCDHVYSSRFMSVLYSKKVADEYPWTQAVPDDPHSVSPIPSNDAQSTPKNTPKTSYLKFFQSSGTISLLLPPSSYPAFQLLYPSGPFQLPTQSAVLQLPSHPAPFPSLWLLYPPLPS